MIFLLLRTNCVYLFCVFQLFPCIGVFTSCKYLFLASLKVFLKSCYLNYSSVSSTAPRLCSSIHRLLRTIRRKPSRWIRRTRESSSTSVYGRDAGTLTTLEKWYARIWYEEMGNGMVSHVGYQWSILGLPPGSWRGMVQMTGPGVVPGMTMAQENKGDSWIMMNMVPIWD